MNYYFLPGAGIYGGIKVAFQFVELLHALGVEAVVATPDGSAPSWFPTPVPVVAERDALARLDAGDHLVFSYPFDYERWRATPARLVFHCQGTNPVIDPILADPDVAVLTGWRQATDYARNRGRADAVEVGIAISDVFFEPTEAERAPRVAYMPRKGGAIADACRRVVGHVEWRAIDGATEPEVAVALQASEVYLATAVNEGFGLPALEAMACGCVVVSVPVVGGTEYLHDGWNCVVAEPDQLPTELARVLGDDHAVQRAEMRVHARDAAERYRWSRVRDHLHELLEGDLRFLTD